MGGIDNSEQQYSLRWNDFHASILSSFRHLRDEEDFVDVTLACDGCSFTAHKVVLSACSPYFRSLLKANPCQHPIVILRDVREQDMEALLRFMYNGEVHIGQEQLTDFLKTAQTLQVRGLADVPTKDHQKLLPNTNSLPWPAGSETPTLADNPLSPPPMKRSRSSEQHTPLPPSMTRFSPSPASLTNSHGGGLVNSHHPPTPTRDTPLGPDQASNRDSLLGQALENSQAHANNNNTSQLKGSDSSVHAQSTGEESNSSGDTGLSERGVSGSGGNNPSLPPGLDLVHPKTEPQDYSEHSQQLSTPHHNNSLVLDPSRTPNFPAALLGLQGLLPGPSGMHNNGQDSNFARRGLDMMRVRATDPRPCPKCGKIYRSAHTLRTHLEDKHTVCPGYRCVLCGTVAKSRNSLHSHMSRQHRGISTKDLPVLPMPSPFDPELASRLLAKAGVKVSAAELRARASPTGPPRRSDTRLDLKSSGSSVCGGDDPEDLTIHNSPYPGTPLAARYGSVEMRPLSPPRAPHHPLSTPPHGIKDPRGPSTGSAILDTYLQFIAENSQLQLSAEQAAKMAARMSEEQRRMGLEGLGNLANLGNHRMMDRPEDSSGGEEEEYSEEEEPEPPAIKAE